MIVDFFKFVKRLDVVGGGMRWNGVRNNLEKEVIVLVVICIREDNVGYRVERMYG